VVGLLSFVALTSGIEVVPAGIRNAAETERTIEAFPREANGGINGATGRHHICSS
jgi:hypothetical protein